MIEGQEKKLNYRTGAVKRMLGVRQRGKVEPGTLLRRANDIKAMSPRKRTAFMGMI